MNGLIGLENVRRGDAGPSGADIESFGELDELRARDIDSSKEDGNLQPKAGRASG